GHVAGSRGDGEGPRHGAGGLEGRHQGRGDRHQDPRQPGRLHEAPRPAGLIATSSLTLPTLRVGRVRVSATKALTLPAARPRVPSLSRGGRGPFCFPLPESAPMPTAIRLYVQAVTA